MARFWNDILNANRCFVIAEIGVNHNGSEDLARQLIDVAAQAGADAVKFQTFFAEELVTGAAEQSAYQVTNLGKRTSQLEMLSQLELSPEAYTNLKAYCDSKGVMFLSTPFSERAADMLNDIGVAGFKVSSGDLTHLPLLRHLASLHKPVILSSGMATLGEVEQALCPFKDAGNQNVAVLHCVSDYPTAPVDCNLKAMDSLRQAFGIPIGWSDHTMGNSISLAAVARGAQILEKHYTLAKTLPGPDHVSSLEPDELTHLIREIRIVELALGTGIKKPTASELETARVGRRSLTLGKSIQAGEPLTQNHLVIRRPGTGIAPRFHDDIIGRVVTKDLPAGTCLTWKDLHSTYDPSVIL